MTVMPWDRKPSIYEHLLKHQKANSHLLDGDAGDLPDEKRSDSTVGFAPGAMDGISSHHMSASESQPAVSELRGLIFAYCEAPTVEQKRRIYMFLLHHPVISIVDPLLSELPQTLNFQRLYDLAHSLALESPDREPVKFAISILGGFRRPENRELLFVLGSHDEFTLFAAVALSRLDTGEMDLWHLAKNVNGWGRVHAVERLRDTHDPGIKAWLVREGFRNSVMYEYLAYTCATAGGLAPALNDPKIDAELFDGAGEILQALINGGPAEKIDDFQDGAVAITRYLVHASAMARTLSHFLSLHSIKMYLEDARTDWTRRGGWTTESRSEAQAMSGSILARSCWAEAVSAGLQSLDAIQFSLATTVAKILGIETWDAFWRRLNDFPTNQFCWYHVMSQCNESRIDEVLEFAQHHLPIEQIATGPGNASGVGLKFQLHQCLDYVLQELGRFPGKGFAFVEGAIQSPVIRNRHGAARVLAAWDRAHWPTNAVTLLKAAIDREPEEKVRQNLINVLSEKSPQ